MADKDPEHEEDSESLSATGMFLRSFAPDPPQPAANPELALPAPPAPPQKAEAGEFTRMFRPVLPAEPALAPSPPSPPAPLPVASGSSGSEFTRAFIVPNSKPEQPPPAQTAPPKVKGFSAPGVSDSASAEGSFTRMFRPDLPPSASPQSYEPPQKVSTSSPATPVPAPPARPQATFSSAVEQTPAGPSNSGITELFRALSVDDRKRPEETAYRPEPAPPPRPYTEPTRIPGPEKPAEAMPPGGGVTALLNRLTAETPLIPTVPLPASRVPTQPEMVAPATPADTRGEFTRLIQAAEIHAALTQPSAPPSPLAAPTPAPTLPKLSAAPISMPAVKPLPAASPLPLIAVPVSPNLAAPPPAVLSLGKTKLQEMVPLLLVANAFLMLILILLVAFALHRR